MSNVIDLAIDALSEHPSRDRIARHGYRLEKEIRRNLESTQNGEFASLWADAADTLIREDDEAVTESLDLLLKTIRPSVAILDADTELPHRVTEHTWKLIQAEKARSLRKKIERLLHRLRGILDAEAAGSADGRSPESLKASIGTSFEDTFDFETMSQILSESVPSAELSESRRNRIVSLVNRLEGQRFVSLGDGDDPLGFSFSSCKEAVAAYKERHDEAVELVKAIAIAELEAEGDYREDVHDTLFAGFASQDLEPDIFAALPDYLICTAEKEHLTDSLAAGLPFKILVRTDDVFKPPKVSEGHIALGFNAHQLVDTAIGLTDVYVLQVSASHIFAARESLARGLSYQGPALFSVFSGANDHSPGIPPYLVAAAAVESRVFPIVCYDPEAQGDRNSGLRTELNPQAGADWPVHDLSYEIGGLKAKKEHVAFTMLDFMTLDERFKRHFAIVPRSDWTDAMIPAAQSLDTELGQTTNELPYLMLIDDENRLSRALVDHRAIVETRRCRDIWRGIQSRSIERLDGVKDAEEPAEEPATAKAAVSGGTDAVEFAATGEEAEPQPESRNVEEPYIETARCTSCNECTQINSRMFAYDENQQAYIADPDAGTFRQLVEAAEGCQVAIIHPGKPRNPKEPGLEDLIKRAAEFN